MTLRIGIGKIRVPTASGSTPIDPGILVIQDGHSKAWYQADDLTTITKDGLNRVSLWADKLGSGRDLAMAVDASKPIWTSPDYMRLNGVSQSAKVTGGFAWVQPCMIYAIVRQLTWTTMDLLWDGNTAGLLNLTQSGVSPQLTLLGGVANGNLALNTWGIIIVKVTGVNSKLRIDATAETTGNIPAAPAGFTLGARGDSVSRFFNGDYKEIILRDQIDSPADIQLVYNYLLTRKP